MISFTKMQGFGNDFVILDTPVAADTVVAMCDRRFGIGADGVLAVGKSGQTVTMEYWNADGSHAEMCGNGLRCVARYAFDRGLADGERFVVLTTAGERRVRIGQTIEAEIGRVIIGESIEIEGAIYAVASVGNPHAVTMVDDLAGVDVAGIGDRVGSDRSRFAFGTNVEFVKPTSPSTIEMRVWERGVGETLACGTGMVAAAAVFRGDRDLEAVEVTVPGGIATVRFESEATWLVGPAEYVFEGRWFSGPS